MVARPKKIKVEFISGNLKGLITELSVYHKVETGLIHKPTNTSGKYKVIEILEA